MMMRVARGFTLGAATVWLVRSWTVTGGTDTDISIAVTAVLLAIYAALTYMEGGKQ